jgi:hypothetical protein
MVRIGVYFSHLTCGASFNVFGDKGFHVRPPVVSRQKLESFGNSWVTSGNLVMKKGSYSPPKVIVFHNN